MITELDIIRDVIIEVYNNLYKKEMKQDVLNNAVYLAACEYAPIDKKEFIDYLDKLGKQGLITINPLVAENIDIVNDEPIGESVDKVIEKSDNKVVEKSDNKSDNKSKDDGQNEKVIVNNKSSYSYEYIEDLVKRIKKSNKKSVFDVIKRGKITVFRNYLNTYMKLFKSDYPEIDNIESFLDDVEKDILKFKEDLKSGKSINDYKNSAKKYDDLMKFTRYVYPEYSEEVLKQKQNKKSNSINAVEYLEKVRKQSVIPLYPGDKNKKDITVNQEYYLPIFYDKSEYIYFLNILAHLLKGIKRPLDMPNDFFELNTKLGTILKNRDLTDKETTMKFGISASDFRVYWGQVNKNNEYNDIVESSDVVKVEEINVLEEKSFIAEEKELEDDISILREKAKNLYIEKVKAQFMCDFEKEMSKMIAEKTRVEIDNLVNSSFEEHNRKFIQKVNTQLKGLNIYSKETLENSEKKLNKMINDTIDLFDLIEESLVKAGVNDDCLNALMKMKEELGVQI